jgi:hypothetical protein
MGQSSIVSIIQVDFDLLADSTCGFLTIFPRMTDLLPKKDGFLAFIKWEEY